VTGSLDVREPALAPPASSSASLIRCATPVSSASIAAASAGRWAGSRRVARATIASTMGDSEGTFSDGAGTSWWTCW
jgi:hypothetical protein